MDPIEEFLGELEEMLPNFKLEYLKGKAYLVRNDIPIDEEPSPKMESLTGYSKLCECDESEYRVQIDIDSKRESVEGEEYEIRIQEDTRDRFSRSFAKCCRECIKYPSLNKRLDDLKLKIKTWEKEKNCRVMFP